MLLLGGSALAQPAPTARPAAPQPAPTARPAAPQQAPTSPVGALQPAPDETQRRAVAQALFDEAQKLIADKSFALACPKLEEVVLLQPGKIGAILALARCYESDGKVASAWSRFKNVVEAAKVAGDAREAEAQKKVDELDKRVPRLTLVVRDAIRAVPGLSIKRDGVDVREPQWGVAIPLDAGDHRIEVTAPGKKTWTSDTPLSEGRAITLEVPDLADQAAPRSSATSTAQLPPVSTSPPETGAPGSFLGLPGKTWGLVLGGAGVAGLLAGGVAGGLALGQHDALAAACPSGRCPAGKQADVDAYETTGLASTVGFAAGGALLAAGAALWLFSPSPSPRPAAAGVRPYATLGGAGVTGRF